MQISMTKPGILSRGLLTFPAPRPIIPRLMGGVKAGSPRSIALAHTETSPADDLIRVEGHLIREVSDLIRGASDLPRVAGHLIRGLCDRIRVADDLTRGSGASPAQGRGLATETT